MTFLANACKNESSVTAATYKLLAAEERRASAFHLRPRASRQRLQRRWQNSSLHQQHPRPPQRQQRRMADTSCSIQAVTEAFLEAALTAQRTGDLPLEAYSYEALASWTRNDASESGEATDMSAKYRQKAIELYDKWGSTEKLHQLSSNID